MAVKYFQTFRPSSEYETAAAEAQRRNALADILQQQAYQPIEMSNAAPVSYTQGLAKMLQAYLAGKESRKAREAEQKATAAIEKDVAGVERTGQQLRESLESGRKPLTAAETTPDASGLAMVRGPLDPVRLASTKYGREALVTDPELLEAYKMARMKPTGKLGEVAPDKFTPASLAQYQATGNAAVLVPVERENKKPSAVQEYEYAKDQGFKGSFEDWQTNQRRAGAMTLNMGAPVAGVDEQGNPVFFQPSKAGGAPAIVPGVRPSPKGMTQEQGKVAGFADRVQASNAVLSSPPADLMTAKVADVLPGGNFMLDAPQQQFLQAERDFINAMLRRESGAAIAPSEFESARKQYIPQPGDRPETLEQKRLARERAFSGLARELGPTYKPANQPSVPATGGWGKAEMVK